MIKSLSNNVLFLHNSFVSTCVFALICIPALTMDMRNKYPDNYLHCFPEESKKGSRKSIYGQKNIKASLGKSKILIYRSRPDNELKSSRSAACYSDQMAWTGAEAGGDGCLSVHLLVKVSTRSRCNSMALLLNEKPLPEHSDTFPGVARIT